jgi:hypothetical protein
MFGTSNDVMLLDALKSQDALTVASYIHKCMVAVDLHNPQCEWIKDGREKGDNTAACDL